jgi:hypothetical protein
MSEATTLRMKICSRPCTNWAQWRIRREGEETPYYLCNSHKEQENPQRREGKRDTIQFIGAMADAMEPAQSR